MEKGERNPTLVTFHALAKAMGKDFQEIANIAMR